MDHGSFVTETSVQWFHAETPDRSGGYRIPSYLSLVLAIAQKTNAQIIVGHRTTSCEARKAYPSEAVDQRRNFKPRRR